MLLEVVFMGFQARAVLAMLLVSGAWSPARLHAQSLRHPDAVRAVLQARFPASGAAPRLALEGHAFRGSVLLPCFYQRRGYAPAWSDGEALRPTVVELLAGLSAAEDDGLRAEDYHLAAIKVLTAALPVQPDAARLADLDLLLSDAFLRFSADLRHGKVNPSAIYGDCSFGQDTADLAAILEQAIQTGRVRNTLSGLAPPHPEYELLREALRRYRGIARAGEAAPVAAGPTLRIGQRGERVAALRARLGAAAAADAAEPLQEWENPDLFDAALAEAVRSFQDRHGLEPDGVAGPATVAELNQRAEDHIRQIEVNLERWRWLPHDLGPRHVLVDIGAFRLDAVEASRPALQMRVIVGKPYTHTPMFSSAIHAVLFNPSWYVPRSIAVKEILPKASRDPSYLRRERYEILPGGRLRQKPGPQNSLGRIKFVFPNRFGVYLHDTPARTLFGRTLRAFSHGCIRLEKPLDLAVWALRGDPRWSPEAVRAAIDAGRERTVALPQAIPVHVAYWTARVDPDGTLRLGRDVYQRDPQLARLLQKDSRTE